MTPEQYFQFAEEFFGKALEISKSKNNDYTGGSGNPFANFTGVEQYHITTEAGFITRMSDKLARVATFAKNGQLLVKDESVTDSLRDLANYCCLMAGYIESKRKSYKGNSNIIAFERPDGTREFWKDFHALDYEGAKAGRYSTVSFDLWCKDHERAGNKPIYG